MSLKTLRLSGAPECSLIKGDPLKAGKIELGETHQFYYPHKLLPLGYKTIYFI